MPITLDQLNAASPEEAARMLDGLYEHTPWIAAEALKERPFQSLAHLKHAMAEALARGLWKPRSNSAGVLLAELAGEADAH